MSDPPEARILQSWTVNAAPWIEAVRSGSIQSRRQVTDRAIVDAVMSVHPARVLDIGCGEGWLARALTARGVAVTGIDAIPALITEARRLGGGEFERQDYEDIASGRWQGGPFGAAVCNFSLLGHDSVASLLSGIGRYLGERGHLIVQTLHPVVACGEREYRDGWREGDWTGIGSAFTEPAPWYFRTLASWLSMLGRCGFELLECREPSAAGSSRPSSVIFIVRSSHA
ncbi:MAG TPA: class I SAM-dependent methyltransferase [Steroidobacteraceae bacterium]|jgi:2-polyprenyl-3-methyl-5-hydroxy-6-metoxy-1,4-benzoquinol methylase|nr:class I SAM-dependent methyltransferase [Steroidobacteraceae bacterium]